MDTRPIGQILVPIDFSPCSEAALRMAVMLAQVHRAVITVVHVIDTPALESLNRAGLVEAAAVGQAMGGQLKRLRHYARLNMRRLLGRVACDGVSIRRQVLEGVPYVEVGRLARDQQVDLVVMGTYGGTVGAVDKLFFGSTAEKVVRTVGRPVLTVPLVSGAPSGAASPAITQSQRSQA
ncbi:MAG: universal stress protein [Nitrospiraceae bacterium]